MANKLTEKLKKVRTQYIWANTKNCEACWQCINTCPKQVIGKVGVLWHKHIVFSYADKKRAFHLDL